MNFVYAVADRFCMFAFEKREKKMYHVLELNTCMGDVFLCRLRKQQQTQWENKHLFHILIEATCCAVAIIYNVNIL